MTAHLSHSASDRVGAFSLLHQQLQESVLNNKYTIIFLVEMWYEQQVIIWLVGQLTSRSQTITMGSALALQ